MTRINGRFSRRAFIVGLSSAAAYLAACAPAAQPSPAAAPAKPAKVQPAPTRQPVPDKIAKAQKSPGKGFSWFGVDKIGLIGRAVSVGCFLLLAFGIFVIMRKNS